MRKYKVILGALIWIAIIIIIVLIFFQKGLGEGASKLVRFATTPSQKVNVEAKNLAKDEKVMTIDQNGQLSFIGYVESVKKNTQGKNVVTLVLDPEYPLLTTDSKLSVVNAKRNMNWALQTILPDHKLRKVKQELINFKNENQAEIMRLISFVAKDLTEEAIQTLNQNLSKSFASHEEELSIILDRHNKNLKKDLIPVLKKQLGPNAKEKLKPILTVIGEEMWDALPVWSFTWRAMIDKIPGTKQDRTKKQFEKFFEDKAIPIFASHESEFVRVAEELVIQASKDKKIRKQLAVLGQKLVNDSEFKKLINIILQEALIEPFQGKRLIDRLMANKELEKAFDDLNKKFDPVLKNITQIIIKNDEGKIDEDLVQAIRRVFFGRDDRVLIVKFNKESKRAQPDYIFIAEGREGNE